MLWNISGERIRIPVNVTATGDTVIIPAQTNGAIFIHELIGNPSVAMTLTVKCGARVVRSFTLAAGQALTENDIAGMDGEPAFLCNVGEAFILNTSAAGTFTGGLTYSIRN